MADLPIFDLSWQAWYTLGAVGLVMAALATNRINTDVAMVGGLTLLLLAQIIDPVAAVAGFAHPAVLVIGAMFVIAAGVEETGAMEMIASRMLGRPKSLHGAQFRLMAPVSVMSALMNTTPIVAIFLPIIRDWARKLQFSPSKLFLPLSYAAILGGVCTMIGTSSNVTVNELYLELIENNGEWLSRFGITEEKQLHQQFWWMSVVAIPCAIFGTGFVILSSRWLLPARKPALDTTGDAKRYTVEMMVQPTSPIVGKTIEEAGLRHLPGLFLSEIERSNERIPAVSPDVRLEADDRLIFVGIVESVVDLRKIRGLVPATDQVEKIDAPARAREIVEAVVAHTSPLVGRTVRASKFRTTYNAAIIAVARRGHRIEKKIGDIRLQAGDTLLLVTPPGFKRAYRNSDDFYLVSEVEGAREIRHERAWLSLAIFALFVALLSMGIFHPISAAFFCAMLMVGTRCVTGTIARSSIRWNILAVIGAAIGIGRAMEQTGAASALAESLLQIVGDAGPHVILFLIYALTSIFAQFVTNNGAAVLMFPITVITVQDLNLNPQPFIIALLIAAGTNLMTPVAYQTNLMVYGPGGYRFSDFLRIGIPTTIILGITTTILAPLVYPFHAGSP